MRCDDLGREVRREIDELAQRSTVRHAVEARLFADLGPKWRPPRLRRAWVAGGFAFAAVVCTAVGVWRSRPIGFTVAGEGTGRVGGEVVVVADPKLIAFSEGTTVDLLAGRAHVTHTTAQGAEVALDEGSVRASVRRRPAARWSFRAGPYLVAVTGTRFQLTWTPSSQRFALVMQEGRVIVSGGSLPTARELHAGESLTIAPDAASPPVASPPEAPRVAPAASVPRPRAVKWPGPAPRVRASVPTVGSLPSEAERLFADADRARLAGDEHAAVELFERLDREHPQDRLAPLAAFAAGRLRLSPLGDARGALVDFERARRQGPQATFDEDLRARMIEALERTGDRERCRQERARYLRDYPGRPHVANVREGCD